MDTLLSVVVGLILGGALLLSSNPLTHGWLAFCEEEWSLAAGQGTARALRLALIGAGCLFIILGLSNLWRA